MGFTDMLRISQALFLRASLFLLPILLWGQAQQGEIRIQVQDSSGAAMQASGKIANTATGAVRSFQTDSQGLYTIQGLTPGPYRLEISRTGFASEPISIDVASGASLSQTVT